MKWFVVAAIVLLTLAVTPAFADDLTVVSTNAAWQQVNSAAYGPFTWVLPASIPGCGSENETTCEPIGHFVLNKAAGQGSINEFIHFDEFDVNGDQVVSDYILLGNGASGNFEVWFFSDPTFPGLNTDGTITWNGVQYFDLTGGQLCLENSSTGCIVGQQINDQNLSGLTITFGSDGESSFDPFGAGYDTSDGISFSGVSAPQNPVPEPASLVLLGTGLAGLLRKRFVA